MPPSPPVSAPAAPLCVRKWRLIDIGPIVAVGYRPDIISRPRSRPYRGLCIPFQGQVVFQERIQCFLKNKRGIRVISKGNP